MSPARFRPQVGGKEVSIHLTTAVFIGQILVVILCGVDIVIIIPTITIEAICQIGLRPEPRKRK
jgi:uncharacterized membrane protein